MKNKATDKQIMAAYGQSYKLMQEAKRHDDMLRKSKNKARKIKCK